MPCVKKDSMSSNGLKGKQIRLKSSLNALKSLYDSTLNSFKSKLDLITKETFEFGEELFFANSSEFTSKFEEIQNCINRCTDELIEINLAFCSNESFEKNPYEDKSNVIRKESSIDSTAMQNDDKISEINFEEVKSLLSDRTGFEFTLDSNCCDSDEKKNTEKDLIRTLTVSSIGSLEQLSSIENFNEAPPSQTDIKNFKGVDKSILSLCTGLKFDVVVSDVASPSEFAIQLEDCQDVLVALQQDINAYYSQQRTTNLDVLDFYVGLTCIAIFPCDQCWYRARVTEVESDKTCKVLYIDFGNSCCIERSNIKKIIKEFEEIPQMSIPCHLSGVQPFIGGKEWPAKTVLWFNDFVLNKKFLAKFHETQDVESKVSNHVSLYKQVKIEYCCILWNVATSLIYNELAKEKEKCRCCFITQESNESFPTFSNKNLTSKNPLPEITSTPRKNYLRKESFSSISQGSVHSSTRRPRSIPAGAERSLKLGAREFTKSPQQPRSDPLHRNLSYVEHLEELSGSRCQALEKNLDPMWTDFYSKRNNYVTDVDNACVAVENINWDRVKICKYYTKGKCWKGNNCDFSHSRDKDVLYEDKILAYQAVPELELTPGAWVIVKVTHKQPLTSLFYCQVLRTLSPESCLQNLEALSAKDCIKQSEPLEQLTEELRQYYSLHRRRLAVDSDPFCGEMHVILVEKTYRRATVVEIAQRGRLKIFLMDYGQTIWINKDRLFPLHQAFMHLPCQAILCENNSPLCPVTSHLYLAKVMTYLSGSDEPVSLHLSQEL